METTAMTDSIPTRRILVWDVPTRLFHWLLVASFAGAFLTAESERLRDVHVALGYTFAGLIGFRLVWGFAGTRYARFRSFLFPPAELWRYLRALPTRAPRRYLGHNPAGGLAIFALLALGLGTAATGWATFNDLGGEALEELHEGLAFAMLAVVAVHVAGVLLGSLQHRENLVMAMVTGRKQGHPTHAIRRGHAWLALLMAAAVVAFWTWQPLAAVPGARPAERSAASHDADERG
jgi:cytochrome b